MIKINRDDFSSCESKSHGVSFALSHSLNGGRVR